MRKFCYLTHGLHICSEIYCPELLSVAEPADKKDLVHIRYGPLSEVKTDGENRDHSSIAGKDFLLFWLDGVARYLVRNGKEIVVDPSAGADQDEIRLFLLGSALGALLHQRGQLVIHGSAIQTARGAALFVGSSAAGKSTLAGAFRARGYAVLADDVCAILADTSRGPRLHPGTNQIKLWADAAEKLDYRTEAGYRVRPADDKFRFPIDQPAPRAPVPLCAIYQLLANGAEVVALEPLTEGETFRVLLTHTYRNHLIEPFGMQVNHFKQAVNVARGVKTAWRIRRPQNRFLIDELVHAVEESLSL